MTFADICQRVAEAGRSGAVVTFVPSPVTDARKAAFTPEEASEFIAELQPLLDLPDGEVRRIVDGYAAQYNTVLP